MNRRQQPERMAGMNSIRELASMEEVGLCNIINTGLFNDIITGYMALAMEHVVAFDKLSKRDKQIVLKQGMPHIFDEFAAEEALEAARK